MRRVIAILVLSAALFGFFAAPRCHAMDPVTIAILAPILMPYAKQAASYALKALIRTGPGWVKCGKEMLNIFRLPLGLLQVTLLLPFGYGMDGLENIWDGLKAPVMMMFQFFALPFRGFGLM